MRNPAIGYTSLMAGQDLVAPIITMASSATAVSVSCRYGSEAFLRLLAGITAIVARDERSRAERALDVLITLRRDVHLPNQTEFLMRGCSLETTTSSFDNPDQEASIPLAGLRQCNSGMWSLLKRLRSGHRA